jgi:hypothetical protein
MSPELLARRWLRLDALYCAAAGDIALAACIPLARLYHVPVAVTAGLGAGVLAWAWLLARFARRRDWRQPLAAVTAANAAAAAAIAALAPAAPALAGSLLLAAVALEVAALAAIQLRTLRRRQ